MNTLGKAVLGTLVIGIAVAVPMAIRGSILRDSERDARDWKTGLRRRDAELRSTIRELRR